MTQEVAQPLPVAQDSSFLSVVAAGLRAARDDWRAMYDNEKALALHGDLTRAGIEHNIDDLIQALFPSTAAVSSPATHEEDWIAVALARVSKRLEDDVRSELALQNAASTSRALDIVRRFVSDLPKIRRLLDSDVAAAFAGDPAAKSLYEVLLCYPGVRAVIHHRLAHRLYTLGAPLIARVISEKAHSQTGIDIHPGADIGASFFIDHGTGVVIGETAVIGRGVRLYQAVTLGARTFPQGKDGALLKGLPRHPIVEDGVVIYAGATILGRVRLGAGAVIGGGVWLTEDVPPGAVIRQAAADRELANGVTRPPGQAAVGDVGGPTFMDRQGGI